MMTITTEDQSLLFKQSGISCPHCGGSNRSVANFCCVCGQMLSPMTGNKTRLLKVSGEIVLSLLGPSGSDFEPRFAWSPDGSHLAYIDRGATYGNGKTKLVDDLFVIPSHGPFLEFSEGEDRMFGSVCEEPNQADPECMPTWSPDGKWVAYSSLVDRKIWMIGAERGSEPCPLTWGRGLIDDRPTWSPDGVYLLYRARALAANRSELRLLNIGKREVQRFEYGEYVAWSPDGKRFASVGGSSSPWAPLALRLYELRSDRYMLSAKLPRNTYSGRQLTWLDTEKLLFSETWTGKLLEAGGIRCLDLRENALQLLLSGPLTFAVSSEKANIAVAHLRYSTGGDIDSPIVSSVVLLSGDNWHPVELLSTLAKEERSSETDLGPILQIHCFSPDGSKILYQRGAELWAVNIDGTGLQRLTFGYAPRWSPDGQFIAFLRREKQGTYALWVMRVGLA